MLSIVVGYIEEIDSVDLNRNLNRKYCHLKIKSIGDSKIDFYVIDRNYIDFSKFKVGSYVFVEYYIRNFVNFKDKIKKIKKIEIINVDNINLDNDLPF